MSSSLVEKVETLTGLLDDNVFVANPSFFVKDNEDVSKCIYVEIKSYSYRLSYRAPFEDTWNSA